MRTLFLGLFTVHLLQGCASLPLASGSGIAPSTPLPTDSQVVHGVLPNGLQYYIRANSEPPRRAELRLVVRVGSILEDEDQRGLAHFVEHMAFNGTRSFAKQTLVEYLERIGMRFGADINASTSFDETVYSLTLPTDTAGVLETGMRILEEWAHQVTFDSTEVERERGVVIEEWRLSQGAGSRIQEKQFPILTAGSRYPDRMPIGLPDSLRTFSHASLRRFYEEWYRPDLMAVVAVGDFDPERMEAMIRERFGGLVNPSTPRPRERFTVPRHPDTRVSVVTDAEATSSSVSIYLKHEPVVWTTVGSYRRWLVETLATGMLVSRINERSSQLDSPFLDLSTYQGRFLLPLTVSLFNVRVPPGGVARGLEEMLLEMRRASEHGFLESELEREKEATLRRLEQRYLERGRATSEGFAGEYVAGFAYGGTAIGIESEYPLQSRLLEEIDVGEVSRLAREWLDAADRVVLVTAPDPASVPDEATLRAVIDTARRRPVLAYVDSVSDAPLLERLPTPGSVVSRRRIDSVDVSEWRLSNGVRLLLKPTDLSPDEVILVGRSPGGTSLLPDSDFFAAQTAAAVAQAGGVGSLSVVNLTKRLAGKSASVGFDITENAELVSGGGSPRDLETLFQLVHLKFVAPRLDSAAVEVYRAQAKATLADRSASPEQVLSDTLRSLLTQNHLRFRPLESEDFDRLDMRRSMRIYEERFADASDFTFILVGSFDTLEVKRLAETYLASLPSLNRAERARDIGMRPPTGVVRSTVRKGLEPKAITQVVFTGEMDFTRESIYSLNTLASVLEIRFREALREDLSATYGVQVTAGAAREPWSRYQLSLAFGSDPARADEITEAAFAEIARLKRAGPTEDELRRVKESALRARETSFRSNQFWLSQLLSYDTNGWDFRGILEYPEWLDRLTASVVTDAASRYLDTSRYVQATLLPEETAR